MDSDDYSYLMTLEEPTINPNNASKNISNYVKKDDLKLFNIFDSNTIKFD